MTTSPSTIPTSASHYLNQMATGWAETKVNDGNNIDRPPEGVAPAFIYKMEVKEDKTRIGGKQGEEKACLTVTFHYKQARDKQHPDYNAKKGEFYDFPGSRITLLPGWQNLPENQQIRFSLDAGRLKNFINVLCQVPEGQPSPLPAEGLAKIQDLLNTRQITVNLKSSYRTDPNDKTKTYYSDNVVDLISG
jgi:hypothetical protein